MCVDEAQQAEAVLMLKAVMQFEERQSGSGSGSGSDRPGSSQRARERAHGVNKSSSETLARVFHVLAMLNYLLHDNDKANNSRP